MCLDPIAVATENLGDLASPKQANLAARRPRCFGEQFDQQVGGARDGHRCASVSDIETPATTRRVGLPTLPWHSRRRRRLVWDNVVPNSWQNPAYTGCLPSTRPPDAVLFPCKSLRSLAPCPRFTRERSQVRNPPRP